METQTQWTRVLRSLREQRHALAPVVANLHVSFTNDAIILHAPNASIFQMLSKYKSTLPDNVQIQFAKRVHATKTVEQKLALLFGDKLEIEVQ